MQTEEQATREMKQVTIEEFRANPDRYVYGFHNLTIIADGSPLGYYIRAPHATPEERQTAWNQLEATVQQVLAETGMTRDELANLFDLTMPVPDASDR